MASKPIIVDDIFKIKEFLSEKSESIVKFIDENPINEYKLIIKHISHSDLTNSGKRNGMEEGLEKNLLYYLSISEMEEIEKVRNKPFESAKQSNIFMPSIFYEFLGVPELERRQGNQTTQHEHPIINDYADVYLVNDTLKYFDIKYTNRILEKLNKKTIWSEEQNKLNLSNTEFTPIQLTHAIHGIGTKNDEEFHKLRKSIFKSDTIMILLSKNHQIDKKYVFIMLEKNPKFFTIIGESNESWEKYLEQNDRKALYDLMKKDDLNNAESIKTRKNQNKWRNLLAQEMMSYTTSESEIFCPLTYISANYNNVGTLFRASHIKAFNECDINEAFDINNGILMIANADALFDKHLITIDQQGNIVYSYLLQNEHKLISELKLADKVFNGILNPKRKEYLKRHNEIFEEKEIKRKLSNGILEDSDE